ncbi:MAG: YncE family protein [Muribaculaceae bacterium]|nr:YncE family protein [Muribaculaceae bacterium]
MISIRNKIMLLVALMAMVLLVACREEQFIFVPEEVEVTLPEYTSLQGFYLLNEGNMNSNKATLDYYNFRTGRYTRNVFAFANPNVPKEMGDVGNDLGIYGSKLYAVINCSNKIDVMDKNTVKKIGQIDIPNCRYIKFYGGYAYVTSYAGPVELSPEYTQRGYVAKIDTATLQVVDKCLVGFQPDELDIVNGKIYVANSGGYMVPNYENTVSVIDIDTFTEDSRIEIAINLQCCKADSHGMLWLSSRGDYYDNQSRLYVYDTRHQRLAKTLDLRVSNMWLDGDSLYVIGAQFSYVTMNYETTYAIINTLTMEQVSSKFITDGTDATIVMPYGIAVNPITKDIYVTDASSYVDAGRLYCFSSDGIKKWDVRTGDIPAHFVFLGDNINEK